MRPLFKYTLNNLLDYFNLSQDDLEILIRNGVLIPENWENKGEIERQKIINEKFQYVVWTFEEVQRFQNILEVIRNNYILSLSPLIRHVEEFITNFHTLSDRVFLRLGEIQLKINELEILVEKRDTWIDLSFFCKQTGYSKKTIYNLIKKIDARSMHLDLAPYNKIIWHKRDKKQWECRWIDFERARKKLTYEQKLAEAKRKGMFKKRPEVKF